MLKVYKRSSVDWDRARELLEEGSGAAGRVRHTLESLSDESREAMLTAAAVAGGWTRMTIWVIVGASLAVVLAATVLAAIVHRFLLQAADRRRLALFVERNPNPVLRLDGLGRVEFGNPSAAALAADLCGGGDALGELLPPNMGPHLRGAASADGTTVRLEHSLRDTDLSVELHYIDELDIHHAYLTDVTAERAARTRVEYLAFNDRLTGLPNWESLERDISRRLAEAAKPDDVYLAILKIDGWRTIVQSFGARESDVLLTHVAQALREAFEARRSDTRVYRIEGDTFAMLVPSDQAGGPAHEWLVDTLRRLADAPLHVEAQRLFITFGAGGAYGQMDDHAESLSRKASVALSEANRAGPGTARLFVKALDEKGKSRLALQADLQSAIGGNELFLVYQPQFEIASMRLVGAEALIRWNHPVRGLVSPGEFMPLAEQSALILPIGRWVMRTAAEQVQQFHARGLGEVSVAVNVSARQFADPDFLADLRTILDETGVDPGALELEITEGVAMLDTARTIVVLETIRDWGLRLSIDDFGTGFSSLSYLKRMPLDKLKIDQSFVRGLPGVAEDCAIAQAVIDLGHRMKLRIVAEGVETPEQLAWLRSRGCDVVQGYLTGRPSLPEDLVKAALSWQTADRPMRASAT